MKQNTLTMIDVEDDNQLCGNCGKTKEVCACGEEDSCIKCGKAGSFPDSICTSCDNERLL